MIQEYLEYVEDAKATILLLDDDAVALKVGRAILKDAGYHVIPASDAIQGLDILGKRTDIDLIVTDNQMPGLTGLEMAEVLYTKNCDIPIIMVTSQMDERVVTMGGRLGIKGFLEKPYQHMHMHGIVRSVLGFRSGKEEVG